MCSAPLSFLHGFCLECGCYGWKCILGHKNEGHPGSEDYGPTILTLDWHGMRWTHGRETSILLKSLGWGFWYLEMYVIAENNPFLATEFYSFFFEHVVIEDFLWAWNYIMKQNHFIFYLKFIKSFGEVFRTRLLFTFGSSLLLSQAYHTIPISFTMKELFFLTVFYTDAGVWVSYLAKVNNNA